MNPDLEVMSRHNTPRPIFSNLHLNNVHDNYLFEDRACTGQYFQIRAQHNTNMKLLYSESFGLKFIQTSQVVEGDQRLKRMQLDSSPSF